MTSIYKKDTFISNSVSPYNIICSIFTGRNSIIKVIGIIIHFYNRLINVILNSYNLFSQLQIPH